MSRRRCVYGSECALSVCIDNQRLLALLPFENSRDRQIARREPKRTQRASNITGKLTVPDIDVLQVRVTNDSVSSKSGAAGLSQRAAVSCAVVAVLLSG